MVARVQSSPASIHNYLIRMFDSDLPSSSSKAFADSLLEDNADDALFGYDKTAVPNGFKRGPPDLDSLSDFENDSDDEMQMRPGGTLDRPASTLYGCVTPTSFCLLI
jgi:hypothetical protein